MRKGPFWLAAWAATLAAVGAARAAETPVALERWDLARFEEAARQRNLAVAEARAEVDLNRGRLMEADWALYRFPQIQWQSVAAPIPSLQGDPFKTTTPTNVFAGFAGIFQQHKVDIVIPVFTFGKLRNANKAADAGVAAAEHGVAKSRAEILRDVRKAYWSVKVAVEVLKVIQEGWGRIVSAEKKLEELLEKGSKEVEELDKNRLATFVAEVATRRQEAVKFDELSRYALRLVAGLPQTANVDADTAPLRIVQVSVPPQETLVETAVRERSEIKALNELVRVRQSLADLGRSNYYPDIFLAGTVGVARCNVCTDQVNPWVFDPFNVDLYGGALGIRLTLDYPQKIAKVRQAEAELRKIEAQRQRAIEGIRLEVRNAYLEWKQTKEQLATTTKGRKAAQGWLIQATINFETGLVKLRDLTDALGAWFKLRLEELRAVYNYNVAVANLSFAVGKDLPAVGR
jgi:outer membrane protein TolC